MVLVEEAGVSGKGRVQSFKLSLLRWYNERREVNLTF